jgi:rod shape determining protein RodA
MFRKIAIFDNFDFVLGFFSAILIVISLVVLNSISASIFPQYFAFIILGFLVFLFFLQIDFEVLVAFSKIIYILSIVFLFIPLIIGQVTRGSIRWIPIGQLTLQPSELVRPFLILFFAVYLTETELNVKRFVWGIFYMALPLALILIQPSLGVAILTGIGFLGVVLASSIDKKYLLAGFAMISFLAPFLYKILQPYQKQRVVSFLDPSTDPTGVGYNSIQSMISVGAGKLLGRGLGKGVQTQLAFLPEKHTDFIFAAIAEELGFVGSMFLLVIIFFLLYRIAIISGKAKSPAARAFVSGVFLVLFIESMIHIGMNMGIFPITGVPLPLVSAGGSSFIATMIMLAVTMNAKKPSS